MAFPHLQVLKCPMTSLQGNLKWLLCSWTNNLAALEQLDSKMKRQYFNFETCHVFFRARFQTGNISPVMTQWYPSLAFDLQNLWNLRLISSLEASLAEGRFFYTWSNVKEQEILEVEWNHFSIQKPLILVKRKEVQTNIVFEYRKFLPCYSNSISPAPQCNGSKAGELRPVLVQCLIF